MNVDIKELKNDSNDIKKVQEFLFKMIKLEFGYDYVPEWHQDIVNLNDYYINSERNAFFVAYSESGEIIGAIGLRAYDKDFPEFRHLYSNETTSSIWNTHRNLDGALKFWTKMGFVITLDEEDDLETVHMEKYIKKLEITPQASILTYTIKL